MKTLLTGDKIDTRFEFLMCNTSAGETKMALLLSLLRCAAVIILRSFSTFMVNRGVVEARRRLAKIAGLTLLVLWSGAPVAGEVVKYYYTDAQGTPLVITDSNGVPIATLDYRPYAAQALGQPADGPGYTGHVTDADSGLVYMQQRYYDPEIGRFLSVDPAKINDSQDANLNRYKYAANNPYRFTDPDGRQEYAAEKFGDSYHTWSPQEQAPFIAVAVPVFVAAVAATPLVGPELATVLRAGLKQSAEEPKVEPSKPADSTIYRMGDSKESPTRLARKAQESEDHTGIHGVSGSTTKPSGPCSSASCSSLESAGFPVHSTPSKNDPGHVTIELPKPVTKEIANNLNDTLGR